MVYLLENMFRQQSEYAKQAEESDEFSRTEVMEKMKAVREKTVELVGDFLSDDQLAQLTELLDSSMNRPAGGRPSERFIEGVHSFREVFPGKHRSSYH